MKGNAAAAVVVVTVLDVVVDEDDVMYISRRNDKIASIRMFRLLN